MSEEERSEGERTFEERRARIWRLLEELTGRPHVVLDVPAREPHWALALADPLDAFVRHSDVWTVTLPRSGATFPLTRVVDLPEDFDEILRSDPNTTYWVEESPPPESPQDTVDWAAPEALVGAPLFLSTCFADPAVAAEAQKQRALNPEWTKWLFEEVFPPALAAAEAAAWDPQPVRLGREWLHATRHFQPEPGGPIVSRSYRAVIEPARLPRGEYLRWLRAEVYDRAGQRILARAREVPFNALTPEEAAGAGSLDAQSPDVGETPPVALTASEHLLLDGLLCGRSEKDIAREMGWSRKALNFHRQPGAQVSRSLTHCALPFRL